MNSIENNYNIYNDLKESVQYKLESVEKEREEILIYLRKAKIVKSILDLLDIMENKLVTPRDKFLYIFPEYNDELYKDRKEKLRYIEGIISDLKEILSYLNASQYVHWEHNKS